MESTAPVKVIQFLARTRASMLDACAACEGELLDAGREAHLTEEVEGRAQAEVLFLGDASVGVGLEGGIHADVLEGDLELFWSWST